MSNNVGGGNLGARLQALLRTGQETLTRVGQDALSRLKGLGSKEGEGPDVKGVDAQGSRGAQGTRSKKTKGSRNAALDALVGGQDDFGLVDDDERERKRKRRMFTGDMSSDAFEARDSTDDRSAVAHISKEFRGQVASGMVEGRSFTQGSCLVPDTPPEESEEDAAAAKKKRR